MGKSKIVQVKSPLVFGENGRIDNDILYQMFEAGLNALSGSNDYIGYLESTFGDGEVVGFKVNGLAGPGMSTRPEVVNVLSSMLKEAGIPQKKHIIWDRFDRELSTLGFEIKSKGSGPLCFGTDHRGVGYSQTLVSKGKIGGLLSRILEEYCESIINIPVLKDHSLAGITCALKNHFGSIHNPNKYHDNGCDPYVADLNSLEQIMSKQRLIVVDALKIQYHGGPAFHGQWAANYGALLFGTDPVAIDAIGSEIIEEMRKKAGLEILKGTKREPIYIRTAAKYGLGTDLMENIDLVLIEI